MAIVALTTFIEVRDSRNRVQYRHQNSQPGKKIKLGNQSFSYLSFLYQGAAKSRTGDNLEAALVMSDNWLSKGIAAKAVRNNWRVRVDSCVMNSGFTAVSRTLTTDYWLMASMSYDTTTVEILLSSAIDAVGANGPTRVLTTAQVGALPVTGSLSNR